MAWRATLFCAYHRNSDCEREMEPRISVTNRSGRNLEAPLKCYRDGRGLLTFRSGAPRKT